MLKTPSQHITVGLNTKHLMELEEVMKLNHGRLDGRLGKLAVPSNSCMSGLLHSRRWLCPKIFLQRRVCRAQLLDREVFRRSRPVFHVSGHGVSLSGVSTWQKNQYYSMMMYDVLCFVHFHHVHSLKCKPWTLLHLTENTIHFFWLLREVQLHTSFQAIQPKPSNLVTSNASE